MTQGRMITEAELIADLRRVYSETGSVSSETYFRAKPGARKVGRHAYSPIKRLFGGWTAFVQAAGLAEALGKPQASLGGRPAGSTGPTARDHALAEARELRLRQAAARGLVLCLRCKTTFESWDRRRNRICPRCLKYLEDNDYGNSFLAEEVSGHIGNQKIMNVVRRRP